VGFKPKISAGERPQTYALDRAATGTGVWIYGSKFINLTEIHVQLSSSEKMKTASIFAHVIRE
jgi:hypothetical protein